MTSKIINMTDIEGCTVDVNIGDNIGRTPLITAIGAHKSTGSFARDVDIDVPLLLIQNADNRKIDLNARYLGKTALDIAIDISQAKRLAANDMSLVVSALKKLSPLDK